MPHRGGIPYLRIGALRNRYSRLGGLGALDQSIASAGNFGTIVLAARNLDQGAFGQFALGITLYFSLQGAIRSVALEPLLVEAESGAELECRTADLHRFLTISVTAGLLGLASFDSMSDIVLPLAVSAPALLVADFGRAVAYRSGDIKVSILSNAIWTVASWTTILAATLFLAVGTPVFLACWGLSALPSLWPLRAEIRELLNRRGMKRRPSLHPQRSRVFFAEYLASASLTQGPTYIIGAIAGAASLAAFRGAEILFAPLLVVGMGLNQVFVPAASRLRNRLDRLTLLSGAVSGLLVCLGSVLWLGWLVLAPSDFGQALLGATWPEARRMAGLVGGGVLLWGARMGPSLYLRASLRLRLSFTVRLVSAAALVASVSLGAAQGVPELGYFVGQAIAASAYFGAVLFDRKRESLSAVRL